MTESGTSLASGQYMEASKLGQRSPGK